MRVEVVRGLGKIADIDDGSYEFVGTTVTVTEYHAGSERQIFVYAMRPGEFANVIKTGPQAVKVQIDE
jgi:hypothetical protein